MVKCPREHRCPKKVAKYARTAHGRHLGTETPIGQARWRLLQYRRMVIRRAIENVLHLGNIARLNSLQRDRFKCK